MLTRKRLQKPVTLLATALMLVTTPIAVFAATPELAAVAPADTLMYIEWHGADSFMDGEHPFPYQALVDSIANINVDDEDFAMWVHLIGSLAEVCWTSRVSVGLQDVTVENGRPDIQAVLVVAGPQSAKLLDMLKAVADDSHQRYEPVQIGGVDALVFPADVSLIALNHKDHFVLSISKTAVEKTLAGINGKLDATLANDAEFKFINGKMVRDGQKLAANMYVNAPRFIARAKALANEAAGGDLPPMVDQVIEEAGLNGVKGKGAQLALADGAWRLSGYLHAPAPRKGIVKLFEQTPVSEDDYAFVPADAYFFDVCHFDAYGAYKTLLESAGKIDEGYPPAVNNLVMMSTGMVGVHVVEDLLAKTDGRWTIYDAPSHGGTFFTGMAVVVGAKDAQALHDNLNQMASRLARYAGEHFKCAPKPATYDGREMTVLRFKGLPIGYAPSWGVIDGRLVVGMFPQVVAAVMNQIDKKTRTSSITDREDFKKALATMPKDASSISFCDSRSTSRWLYSNRLSLTAMLENWLGPQQDWDGILAVPEVDEVLKTKVQSVSALKSDDDGVLYAATSPFQLGYLQTQFAGASSIATIALLISILLPSLSRARALSKRTVSAANLGGIGQACMIYAMDNNDRFPPDLKTLLDTGNIAPNMLEAPADDTKHAGGSYIYVSGQTADGDPRNVIAYERDGINDGEGRNVLFADGHVEFMRGDSSNQAIRDTYVRLGRESEMPDLDR